jgi:hypothetical protein
MVDGVHNGIGDGGLPRGRAAGHPNDQRLSLHDNMVAQTPPARQKAGPFNYSGRDWNYQSKYILFFKG